MLSGAHTAIAYAALALAIVGAGWSILAALGRAAVDQRLRRYGWLVVCLVGAGAAAGLLMLASGERPADGLHLVYGVIALALIPLTLSFLGDNVRRNAWLLTAAYVVLAVVLYRLFSTG